MIYTSELESWWARSGKSDFGSDTSRNSKSSFSKTTASNSCIKFWIEAFILLRDSYIEESLVLFLRLALILPSRSPSPNFFSQRCFFSKSIVVCSIYHLCAAFKILQCATDCASCFFFQSAYIMAYKKIQNGGWFDTWGRIFVFSVKKFVTGLVCSLQTFVICEKQCFRSDRPKCLSQTILVEKCFVRLNSHVRKK